MTTCNKNIDLENEIIASESQNREYHIPGYNFCGPGTRIGTRLIRGDTGVSELDEACKIHDVEYMKFIDNPSQIRKSDTKLIKKANTIGGISGWLVKNVFKGKQLIEDLGIPSTFLPKLLSRNIPKQKLYGNYLYNTYIGHEN